MIKIILASSISNSTVRCAVGKALPVVVSLLSAVAFSPAMANKLALEEVVVTAQKRAQSLQEVAGAISALDANAIEQRGVQSTEDLFQAIPGLNFSNEQGNDLITIRGIGVQVETGTAEPGVASHIDGIYQARPTMGGLGVNDLERAEVLRGPQGTLYGRNATGGVVNFITAKPTEEFEGAISAGIGSWDKVNASAYVSGPLVQDKLLGRLSVSYTDHDGYVDNLAVGGESELGDDKKEGVRGALRFLPSEDLTIDLSYSYQEQEYDSFQPRLDSDAPTVLGFIPGLLPANSFIPEGPHETAMPAGLPTGEKETEATTLIVNWDINDNVSLKSLTGYIDHATGPDSYNANTFLDRTTREVVFESIRVTRGTDSESWSQEFNLVGSAFDDKLQWTVGTYYFEETFKNFLNFVALDTAPALGGFAGQDSSIEEDISSAAVFFDATYSITDTFRVNAGVRRSRDERDAQQTQFVTFSPGNLLGQPAGTIQTCGEALAAFGFGGQVDQRWDSTSPKFRLEWDAGEDLLLYAQWQEGFKSGGTNEGCNDNFEPEDITAYEAGFKSTLLDGTMVLNGSAYFYEYEDMQIFTGNATGTSVLVLSVPEAELYGAELEMLWNATDLVSVDFTLAASDSEATQSAVFSDSVAIAKFQPGARDIKGNPIPRNPELTASLGMNVDFDTDMGSVALRGELYYSDETQFRVFDNEEDIGPSYTVGNLYASLTAPDDKWTVKAFVKNFTDEEYIYNIVHSITTGPGGRYAPPRHYGVDVTFRF